MKRIILLLIAAMLLGLPAAAQTTKADKKAILRELRDRQMAQRKACQVNRADASCVNLKQHQKQERKQLAKQLGIRPKRHARRH